MVRPHEVEEIGIVGGKEKKKEKQRVTWLGGAEFESLRVCGRLCFRNGSGMGWKVSGRDVKSSSLHQKTLGFYYNF